MLSTLLYTSMALVGFAADDPLPDLSIGDAAPKIEVQEFVRGEPVKEFESGKTYVVEFWATWCLPCRKSIPHLTALQKKYGDVVFIGVSVDEDTKAVKPFVEKMGDKMDYRVAIDARDTDESKMAQSWLDASYQSGIPTAYIVNAQGKVAWIGDPTEMDDPLMQILAGKWDLASKAAQYKEMMAKEKKQAEAKKLAKTLSSRLARAIKDERFDDVLKTVEEAEAQDVDFPDQYFDMRVIRLAAIVIDRKDAAKATELARSLLAKPAGDEDQVPPMSIVLAIVDPRRVLEFSNNRSTEDVERELNKVHFFPPHKLDPDLAKVAAEAADVTAAGMEKEHGANNLELADIHVALAMAYRAAGDKKKGAAEFHKATDVLHAIAKQANDAIDDANAAEKELGE